jgi:hypothetical protein
MYYLINTDQIKNHLTQLNQVDPERTLCWLDLLLENTQNNLSDILRNGEYMIEIDHENKEVTLLWDDLPDEDWKIVFDKEKNKESIYNTFMFAIDHAAQVEWWEDMIRKIR